LTLNRYIRSVNDRYRRHAENADGMTEFEKLIISGE